MVVEIALTTFLNLMISENEFKYHRTNGESKRITPSSNVLSISGLTTKVIRQRVA